MSGAGPASARVREIRIARAVVAAMVEGHRASTREERCGVLLGRVDGPRVEVAALRAVRNAHPASDRAFRLEPAEALRASAEARAEGLDVVGTWHSHPLGPATLSEADVEGLLDASFAPGSGGVAERRPHVFVVSGVGSGRAVVLRAFAGAPPRPLAVVAGRDEGAPSRSR